MIPVVRAIGKRRSAPAGGATPGDYPTGLTMWLDASAITGKTDGQLISSWTDLSGSGNHAVTGNDPTYKTNVAKGGTMPVVRFNGTGQHLNSNAPSSGAAQTVIVVFNILGGGGQPRTLRGATSSGGLQFRIGPSEQLSAVKQSMVDLGSGPVVSSPAYHVGACTWDDAANTLTHRLDAGSRVVLTPINETLSGGQLSVIGRNGANSGEYHTGDICEVASWDVVLSAAVEASIISGLMTKWGIS